MGRDTSAKGGWGGGGGNLVAGRERGGFAVVRGFGNRSLLGIAWYSFSADGCLVLVQSG